MVRVLITGSQGFLGSHLVSSLIKNDYEVMVVNKLKHNSPRIISITKDITKIVPSDIKHSFSTIVHLAAISDIEYCEKNPLECFQTNVVGTQRMLEIAREKNARFIFLSSSHVYGKPKKLPINEQQQRVPLSIYSASKLAGELLCEKYSKDHNLDVTILRLFSVYGPKSPKHSVIYKIINQLLNGTKLTLGNTKSKRDFIFVDDVINALTQIINSKRRGYHVYNIGTGKSTSIYSICKELGKISKKKITIVSQKTKLRPNDVSEMRCNFNKIKRDYNWKPQTSLHEGLEATFRYYFTH